MGIRSFLKAVGSLWLAVVLLMLLLLAMASATAFESTHGMQASQALFYKALWFQSLLALIGLNMLAAVLARFPISRRQIPLVIVHGAIVTILLGAWVTKRWGIDGQLAIREGQTASAFRVAQESVTLERQGGGGRVAADLDSRLARATHPVDLADGPVLRLGDFTATVASYLPDTDEVSDVRDDNPVPNTAVEVVLSMAGEGQEAGHGSNQEMKQWVFARDDGHSHSHGTMSLHVLDSEQALTEALAKAPATQPASSKGTVKVTIDQESYEFPLETVTTQPASIGASGYSVRVLRYLPHAIVGKSGIENASDNPVNPAIEAEITGPKGSFRQLAFAKFPDFQSMHGKPEGQDVKIVFQAGEDQGRQDEPVRLYVAPTGRMGVRFTTEDRQTRSMELTLGKPVETPWPGIRFEVRRRFDRARMAHSVVPAPEVRENPTPALLVKTSRQGREERVWLRKDDPQAVTVDNVPYVLTFSDKAIPLGFEVTLDRFRVGRYPGTERPRSFESHVTFNDPAQAARISRVISMNAPATHGSYTLYQASYHRDQGGRSTSVLSVSWDPGQPIVFAGYISLFVGLLWALAQRVADKRRNRSANNGAQTAGEVVVSS